MCIVTLLNSNELKTCPERTSYFLQQVPFSLGPIYFETSSNTLDTRLPLIL